jgi:hypothetical protein
MEGVGSVTVAIIPALLFRYVQGRIRKSRNARRCDPPALLVIL